MAQEIENYPLEINLGNGQWEIRYFTPSHAQRIQMRSDFNLYFRIPKPVADESDKPKTRTTKQTPESEGVC